VYGFVNMLLKIIRERSPDAIAVAFDSKAPTFRHDKYEAYKIHRKPMPEDLAAQLPVIKEALDAYRITVIQKDGVEADDIMASLAEKATVSGYDVYLVTSDKDMFQVVGDNVFVVKPDGGERLDRSAVMRRFGVAPEKIADILALAGDASDNVPGIPGIGEKTALELIREFGCLDGVLENADRVKGEKRRDLITRFADQARLSRELVTLKKDVPLEFDPLQLEMTAPDRDKISELFKRLEFKRLYSEFAGGGDGRKRNYRVIGDRDGLRGLLGRLSQSKSFSVYVVTGGGIDAEPLGVAFSEEEGEGAYLSLRGGIPLPEIAAALNDLFSRDNVIKVGHDLKRLILALRRPGIELRGPLFDTMVAAYLLNPSRGSYELPDLALQYLDIEIGRLSDAAGTGKKRGGIEDLPVEAVADQACRYSDIAFRLYKLMAPRVVEEGMEPLFIDVEMPLVGVLAGMEERGIRIDTGILSGLSLELSRRISDLESSIYELAGERFSINSHAQLRKILFQKLRLPATRKIKSGYSTDYDALVFLSDRHPLPAKLLDYRRLNKLKSTYVDALPRMVNPRTGRIHTTFHQTGAATGRLSSSDPNLQNIPVRTELGLRIRQAFVPGSGGEIFLAADYSQIDLRILAHLSGDRKLARAFREGDDVHNHTACAVFGVDPPAVTPEMRRQAKTINFGIVYGMSAYGLSRELGIDPAGAQDFINRYFDYYSGVRDYIRKSLAEAGEKGYVKTIMGRRRAVPELKSASKTTREIGQRIAINTPIQGSSADLIKIAMRDIAAALAEGGWRAFMLIQIHDELLFEVDREQAGDFGAMAKAKMESAWKFDVPITVNLKSGNNWGEL